MSYLLYLSTPSLSFSIFFSTFSSSNYTHIDHNLIDIPKLYYPRNETSLSLSLFPSPSFSIFSLLSFFIFLSLCRGVASMSIPPQDIATRNRDEGGNLKLRFSNYVAISVRRGEGEGEETRGQTV